MADIFEAPYARAAAFVNRDGKLLRAKNVVGVAKLETGKYQITVTDDIVLKTAALQATPDTGANWGTSVYVGKTADADHTFIVQTGRGDKASDQPFYVVVL
ncbi:hypothetical protein AB0P15_36725 [Streptomyces sp. NPDC087917]|uniref:hypothetical protein n=1 Tax=Streptomyces sp. NPDC087917 TaxID=3155060 RepID=UPI003421948E